MDLDMDYLLEQLKAVMAIDSPTGYTKNAAEYVCGEYPAAGL